MKKIRFSRLLGTAVILALLVVAVPAAPAQAAYYLYAAPTSGDIGSTVSTTGTGFTPTTDPANPKYVIVYLSSQAPVTNGYIDTHITIYEEVLPIVSTDAAGSFTRSFTVPSSLTDGTTTVSVTAGTYYLYACQYLGTTLNKYIVASTTFIVSGGAGEITIDPDDGPVDTEVEITGTGFAPNADIEIEFNGDEVDIEDGDDETDSDGDFTSYILVPESTAGDQTITVTVSGDEVTEDFTVTPEIFLDMTSAEVGTVVTTDGTGFGRRQSISIWFDNYGVATDQTDSDGSFSVTFTVPDRTAGIYDVEAEDEDENSDLVKFTIFEPAPPPEPEPEPEPEPPTPPQPAVSGSLSPSATGPVGMNLIFTGTGFAAGKTVTVNYDDEEVATGTATAAGIVVAVFPVPKSQAGDHTITADDGTNTLELTFIMESEAPGIPTPLQPAMGVQLESPVVFDWEDVTDDSKPVSYTLQIATDEDFNKSAIALEKKELTESGYTLTEEEELDLGEQNVPYYWRIRATDAASNDGEWTGAGEFSITPPFSIPSWALYTLIGIGGLLLFGVGYFLGRRTAFYY